MISHAQDHPTAASGRAELSASVAMLTSVHERDSESAHPIGPWKTHVQSGDTVSARHGAHSSLGLCREPPQEPLESESSELNMQLRLNRSHSTGRVRPQEALTDTRLAPHSRAHLDARLGRAVLGRGASGAQRGQTPVLTSQDSDTRGGPGLGNWLVKLHHQQGAAELRPRSSTQEGGWCCPRRGGEEGQPGS